MFDLQMLPSLLLLVQLHVTALLRTAAAGRCLLLQPTAKLRAEIALWQHRRHAADAALLGSRWFHC